jgi:hypothetical protein
MTIATWLYSAPPYLGQLVGSLGAQARAERIDHAPLVTAPELVVEMILAAVTGVTARPNG